MQMMQKQTPQSAKNGFFADRDSHTTHSHLQFLKVIRASVAGALFLTRMFAALFSITKAVQKV